MSVNYNEQLAQAEQKRRDAQAAVYQQEWEKSAPQRALEDAERAIDHIHQQAARDEYSRRVEVNRLAVNRTLELNTALIAALEVPDVRKAMALMVEIDAAWQEHRAALLSALEMVVEGYWAPKLAGRFAEQRGLPQAWGWAYAVNEWIASAPDPVTQRIRQGLAYAAGYGNNGQVLFANKGYTAAAAYQRDWQAAYNAW